jgi:tetratricopeptide (TPR) repeat protein
VEEAATAFHAAAVLNPKSLEPHREMANLYGSIGYLDRSVANLERLLALAPNDTDTLVRLGHIYIELAWQDRAGPLLTHAVQLAPDLPAAQYEMARYEWETAHSEASVKRLDAFHIKNPDALQITAKLAEYQMALQHNREAESMLIEALRRLPGAQELERLLAYNWIKQGDSARLKSALDLLNRMIAAGMSDAEPYCRLGQVYERLKHYPEAVTAYEAATRRDPTFENASLALGRLYLRLGRTNEGERLIQFYKTINTNMQAYSQAHERVRKQYKDPGAHLEVALLDVKANRLPESILEFRRVLALRPNDPRAKQGLKQALQKMGRRAEADAIALR